MELGRRNNAISHVVRLIDNITTRIDEGGIDLRFIMPEMNKPTVQQVQAMTDKPNFGSIRIGSNMKANVLEDLVYAPLRNDGQLERPLCVLIIADGEPTGERPDVIKLEILRCGNILEHYKYRREGWSYFPQVSYNYRMSHIWIC
jgi:hypothetical protein